MSAGPALAVNELLLSPPVSSGDVYMPRQFGPPAAKDELLCCNSSPIANVVTPIYRQSRWMHVFAPSNAPFAWTALRMFFRARARIAVESF